MQDSNQIPEGVRGVPVPPTEHDQHIRNRGASPFVATVKDLEHRFRASIERYRQQAADRLSFRQLQQLDERLLKDIGLTRGDLINVQLRVTTLGEIDARRKSRDRIHSLERVASPTAEQADDWSGTTEAATVSAAKCA